MAEGDIGAVIDTLEFEPTACYYPNIIHVAGDVYAIAYTGVDNDGCLITTTIDADGLIGDAVIDSLVFEAGACYNPNIIHIAGDVYAIAYEAAATIGTMHTVLINADGLIGNAVIDSLVFEGYIATTATICHAIENIYVIAYRGTPNDGFICSVAITDEGAISNATLDLLEFDTASAYSPRLIRISDGIIAIAYTSAYYLGTGKIATISVDNAGNIGGAVIDSLVFGDAVHPWFTHIFGTIYAVAFISTNNYGWVATFDVAENGNIGNAIIDSFAFNSAVCFTPCILHVSGDVYAIAYGDSVHDGRIKTITINNDGAITDAIISSALFEATTCYTPNLIYLSKSIYAIAFRDDNINGIVKTISIETIPAGGPQHLMIMGVG